MTATSEAVQRRPGNEKIDKNLPRTYITPAYDFGGTPAEGAVVVNASLPVPISVYDPSRAAP